MVNKYSESYSSGFCQLPFIINSPLFLSSVWCEHVLREQETLQNSQTLPSLKSIAFDSNEILPELFNIEGSVGTGLLIFRFVNWLCGKMWSTRLF